MMSTKEPKTKRTAIEPLEIEPTIEKEVKTAIKRAICAVKYRIDL